MKRTLFLLLAVVLMAGLSGCCGTRGCGPRSCGTYADCPETCQSCDTGGCGSCADCPCPETCQPSDTGGCGSCAQNCGCNQCADQPCGCGDCSVGKGGRLRSLIRSICPGKSASCGCGACAGGGGACVGGRGLGGAHGQNGYNLMAPIAYPYYSLRGPRDFLAKNPPSIGP